MQQRLKDCGFTYSEVRVDLIGKHVYTKLGRGAVIIFDVDSHESMHKLVNQWAECVPATFEVEALLPKEHQEQIARAGIGPMSL